MSNTLSAVFLRLKAILAPYAQAAVLVHDTDDHYYLNTAQPDKNGKAVFLAAAKIGAGKVAFHLMPLYRQPELLNGISPALKKRMQGKSCFNFAAIDETLLAEMQALTQLAISADSG